MERARKRREGGRGGKGAAAARALLEALCAPLLSSSRPGLLPARRRRRPRQRDRKQKCARAVLLFPLLSEMLKNRFFFVAECNWKNTKTEGVVRFV